MEKFDGKKLAALRRAAGFTQKSLASCLGITERIVQMWEAGTSEPTATALLRAMALMQCTPQDLLTEAD